MPETESGKISALLEKAESCSPDYCFPNKLEDIAVLKFAVEQGCHARAPYYLGNLFYDKLQWQEAVRCWEMAAGADPEFPIVHRNLGLAYYNKCRDGKRAQKALEKAFSLNRKDARIFLEPSHMMCRIFKKTFYK